MIAVLQGYHPTQLSGHSQNLSFDSLEVPWQHCMIIIICDEETRTFKKKKKKENGFSWKWVHDKAEAVILLGSEHR